MVELMDEIHKILFNEYMDEVLNKSLSGRLSNQLPEIQHLEYNPTTNTVDVIEVSKETFFNVDFSKLEELYISNYGKSSKGHTEYQGMMGIRNHNGDIVEIYPDMIINDQIFELKTTHKGSIPNLDQQKVYADMFEIPFFNEYGLYPGFDFLPEDRASFPVPTQKWVKSRHKYHEPREVFLKKAYRKRDLNKINRKRARK